MSAVTPRLELSFLRRVRELTLDAGGPIDLLPLLYAVDDVAGTYVASDLLVSLRNRGLIVRVAGSVKHTTSAEADRLLAGRRSVRRRTGPGGR